MFSLLRSALPRSFAGPSTSLLPTASQPARVQSRALSLVPRKTKYRKAHKGRIPMALGGSTKGTTLEWGDYGLRVTTPCRLSAKHLESAEAALKRGLKVVRGSKIYLRVFPDIPVCIKGNETRMGKGKGTFEFWATRAKVGKVIFEIGGPNLRPEIANQVLALAAAKLPATTQVIDKTSLGIVGTEPTERPTLGQKVITRGEVAAKAEVDQAAQVAETPGAAAISG